MDYRKIIKSKGLKQCWIADQIGVSKSMLTKVLNGEKNFSPENKSKFNRLLGIN